MNFDRSPISNKWLIEKLCSLEADIIVTNVHKVIHEDVLNQVNSKFINLHYSIIPAYQGLIGSAPLNAALARKNRIHGVTAHVVTKLVDEGETLVQAAFPIDYSHDIKQRNFEAGCLALLNAILYSNLDSHECIYFNKILVNPADDSLDLIFLTNTFNKLKG